GKTELFIQELEKYGQFNIEEAMTFSSKKQTMGTRINSAYIDTKPVISPDGRTLYFVRQHHPANIDGKNDPQDIYVSHLINGEWSRAENIGYPLNNKNANGVCSVSPDGNRLFVINDGIRKDEPGISMSYKNGNTWSVPQPLYIDDFFNKAPYHDYFMSANEQYLLMSIENKEGFGLQDLFVSFKKPDHTWSKPKNLGSLINTGGSEFSPYLAADNKTLYFASEGHQGLGEADIYYTKRLDDTWQNWLPPKNIGNAVNTVGWDGYYAVSAKGDYAYFVSTGSITDYFEDIYRIALPHEFQPEPVALVSGRVLHAETKEPLDASVIFENAITGYQEGITSSHEVDGGYSLVLPLGKKYSYRATSRGFIPLSENIDLTGKNSYQEVTQDLLLFPIQRGLTIRLNNLFFERGKANILPESRPELERLLHIMQEHPSLVVELGGHTDNQGSDKANLSLSFDRVEKVKDYLVSQGIAKKRLSTQGYGGSRPIADNSDAETRKLNRRVEIKILDY
ncbi:MAG: OmpA family protein, partial [Cyclobacteriaceae bacterium]